MATHAFEHKKTEAPTPLEKEKTEKPEESKETEEDLLKKAEKRVSEFKDSGLAMAEKIAKGEEVDEDIKDELDGMNQEAEDAKEELQLQISQVEEKKNKIEERIHNANRLIDEINEGLSKYGEDLEKVPKNEMERLENLGDKLNTEFHFLSENHPEYIAELLKRIKNPQVRGICIEQIAYLVDEKNAEYFINNVNSFEMSEDVINVLQNSLIRRAPDILLNSLDKIDLTMDQFTQKTLASNPKFIVRNLEKFSLSQEQKSDLIDRCINWNYINDSFLANLGKLGLTDADLVDRALENKPSSLFLNLEKLKITPEQKQKIIYETLNARYTNVDVLISQIDQHGLSKKDINDIADKLLSYHPISALKFSQKLNLTLEQKKRALSRLARNYTQTMHENLDAVNLTEVEFIELLIKFNHNYLFNNFKNLNQDTANKFVANGYGKSVAENLEKFQNINHQKLAEKLIAARDGYYVALNLEKFQGINHQELADKLITNGDGLHVISNLEKFQGINHKKIADKLIADGHGHSVALNLEKFQSINHQELADKLIANGRGGSVAENLEKFTLTPEQRNSIIDTLIKKEPKALLINLTKFTLTPEQQNNLIENLTRTDPVELLRNLEEMTLSSEQQKKLAISLAKILPKELFAHPEILLFVDKDKANLTTKETQNLIMGASDRFLFSFEGNEENAIKQNIANRNTSLKFINKLEPKDKQIALPSIIEHSLDPDFGDLELAKKLIAQLEDEELRKKWEETTPENLSDTEERINIFLKEVKEQSTENRQKIESELVAKHGKEKVEQLLKQIEQSRFFTVNCSAETVGKILESGCIKSCWETKTRDYVSYKGKRHTVELAAGTRGKGTKNDPHPIYGAMAYENGHDELKGVAPGYGNTFIKIKEEVLKNQASFTHGDSFHGSPEHRRFIYNDAVIARARIALEKSERYVEGQILGGVNLEDIETINFPKNSVTQELKKQLNKWQKQYPDIKFNIIE